MSRRSRALVVVLTLIAACVAVPSVAAASEEPHLTVRTFCQTTGGEVVYVVIAADGLPANAEGSFSFVIPEVDGYTGRFPFSTDASGSGSTSIGWSLSGWDDPVLGNDVVLTISAGGTTLTKSVAVVCDPDANAPQTRQECSVGRMFDIFFALFGYTFTNKGDCVAFVSSRGRNQPGRKTSRVP